MEYAIRHVFDSDTGELFDAKEIFTSTEFSFQFRKDFHTNDQVLRCRECGEKATVVGRANGTVFFQHFPKTPYCILKDSSLTATEREAVESHIAGRESKRHKHLKNQIGKYLRSLSGINADTVTVDDHYLKDSKEKRRPDVYGEFNRKSIAFEIQLSQLPAKYIFKRHEFYKRNGVYLIWILDDFDRDGRRQTERDIKYLNAHQNYFFFNDSSIRQSLVVQFKEGRVNSKNQCYYPWNDEMVSLQDLKFDEQEYQVYYRSLQEEQSKAEAKQTLSELQPTIELFRQFYSSDAESFISPIESAIDGIDFASLQILCKRIAPDDNSNLFFRCLEQNGKPYFLMYLLKSHWFPKNLSHKNPEGKNLFEYLFTDSKTIFKRRIEQLLFESDYALTDSDISFLNSVQLSNERNQDREQRVIRALAYNHLRKMDLIELYDKFEGVILTILSAKLNQIVGYGFNNDISLANNAIHSYKSSWGYIEQAFRYYKFWDSLIENDRKKTFHKKHEEYLANKEQSKAYEISRVLTRLFPEVYHPESNATAWLQVDFAKKHQPV